LEHGLPRRDGPVDEPADEAADAEPGDAAEGACEQRLSSVRSGSFVRRVAGGTGHVGEADEGAEHGAHLRHMTRVTLAHVDALDLRPRDRLTARQAPTVALRATHLEPTRAH